MVFVLDRDYALQKHSICQSAHSPADKILSEKEQRLHSVRRLYRGSAPAVSRSQLRGLSADRAGKSTGTKFVGYKSMTLTPSVCSSAFTFDNNLEKQVDGLYQQLLTIRRRMALEFFEFHNSGSWCLIFPTDDRASQKRFATLILANFAQFHKGKGGDLQKELEELYLHPITEDEVLDKLKKLVKKNAHLRPLIESEATYNEFFFPDSELYQVDDYRATSSDESSSGRDNRRKHGPASVLKAKLAPGDDTDQSCVGFHEVRLKSDCNTVNQGIEPVTLHHLTTAVHRVNPMEVNKPTPSSMRPVGTFRNGFSQKRWRL